MTPAGCPVEPALAGTMSRRADRLRRRDRRADRGTGDGNHSDGPSSWLWRRRWHIVVVGHGPGGADWAGLVKGVGQVVTGRKMGRDCSKAVIVSTWRRVRPMSSRPSM